MTRLVEEFAKLPGIGQKSAERLTYHILRSSREDAVRLADAIHDVKDRVSHCSRCFNIAESDPCAICADARRDSGLICVVEQPKDLIALEQTGTYNGLYHVLLGHIAPLDGYEPEDLTIDALVERVKAGGVREVILATNPTLEGDGTALYVSERLRAPGVKITRLARGLPSGASIEFANPAVMTAAPSERRQLDE